MDIHTVCEVLTGTFSYCTNNMQWNLSILLFLQCKLSSALFLKLTCSFTDFTMVKKLCWRRINAYQSEEFPSYKFL